MKERALILPLLWSVPNPCKLPPGLVTEAQGALLGPGTLGQKPDVSRLHQRTCLSVLRCQARTLGHHSLLEQQSGEPGLTAVSKGAGQLWGKLPCILLFRFRFSAHRFSPRCLPTHLHQTRHPACSAPRSKAMPGRPGHNPRGATVGWVWRFRIKRKG